MTDKEHAAAIAKAVAVINSATYAATKDGLALDIDVIETASIGQRYPFKFVGVTVARVVPEQRHTLSGYRHGAAGVGGAGEYA